MRIKNNSFLRFFVWILFLFCFTVISALSQDFYSYSDTWMDDETGLAADPEHPEDNVVYIVGSEVTEINADKIHTLDLQVTITSPMGRSAFENGSWARDSKGTSLSLTVPLSMEFQADPPDSGEYQTLVQHFPSCPESHIPTEGRQFRLFRSILRRI